MNRAIVVLGMHRSGTSAVTRGLMPLGVRLGEPLLPPSPENAKGFWEDVDVLGLNVELINALGSRWDSLCVLDPQMFDEPVTVPFLDRATALLREMSREKGKSFEYKLWFRVVYARLEDGATCLDKPRVRSTWRLYPMIVVAILGSGTHELRR